MPPCTSHPPARPNCLPHTHRVCASYAQHANARSKSVSIKTSGCPGDRHSGHMTTHYCFTSTHRPCHRTHRSLSSYRPCHRRTHRSLPSYSVSDHTSSDHTSSDHTSSDHTSSDHTSSDHTSSDHTSSDHTSSSLT